MGFVSGNVSVRCPVGSRGFGVSLWSYLAAEVTCGKVFCGYRPQNKAHLSEPGTHQRTWRVMGRPFHRLPQTLSMTRRNDSLCSPQDTSRWHSQRQIPAPVKISRKAQQMMTVSTLFVIQFFFFVLSNKVYLNPLQTLQSTNIAMFAGPIQSHRNFSN